jgi:hypothetical protein
MAYRRRARRAASYKVRVTPEKEDDGTNAKPPGSSARHSRVAPAEPEDESTATAPPQKKKWAHSRDHVDLTELDGDTSGKTPTETK